MTFWWQFSKAWVLSEGKWLMETNLVGHSSTCQNGTDSARFYHSRAVQCRVAPLHPTAQNEGCRGHGTIWGSSSRAAWNLWIWQKALAQQKLSVPIP